MTITALLWGNEGEYMVPIHNESEEHEKSKRKQSVSSGKRPSLTADNISSAMKDLILGSCLCNNAVVQTCLADDNGDSTNNTDLATVDGAISKQTTQIVGDAADVALHNFTTTKCSIDREHVKKVNPRINAIPFNSKNKFMVTANILEQTSANQSNDPTVLITMKGAPDFVLSRCSTYKSDHGDEMLPMTDEFRSSIQQRQENLGKSGYRVIAMLQQKMSKTKYDKLIETYKLSKTQQQQQQTQLISDEPDLNGMPVNDYCFIGM